MTNGSNGQRKDDEEMEKIITKKEEDEITREKEKLITKEEGRKVQVCEADGKSFLLAFNRCIVS